MDEFPPNSKKSKEAREDKPRVEQVTSADVTRRKKPLGKQFKEVFFGGDARTAMHYAAINVLLPAFKDMIAEAGNSVIEKMIYGESRSGRRSRPMSTGATGYVSYNRMHPERQDDRPPMPRYISRRARARHDFDEIVLSSRAEAEEVIDRLFDLVGRYGEASVADLYELTGLESSHTDHKWGWTDMRGANVARVRSGGYLLNLPDPEPIG